MEIIVKDFAGHFAENKDYARKIREEKIIPAIDREEIVTIDFKGVDSSTQSFIHALISEILQIQGVKVLDNFKFTNCNKALKSLIGTVVNYSLE